MISPLIDASSALTASSQINSWGFGISALAIATRWHWPPESSCGYLPKYSGANPTSIRPSSMSFWADSLVIDGKNESKGSFKISKTVILGLRDENGS